jgi:hypothetical protein
MRSGEDATGARPQTSSVLDADHGGARIALPEIDLAALGKAGADTGSDSTAKAWFEITITGENMADMFFRFPLTGRDAREIEIKGIPAGKQRSFHGSLLNAQRILTHEGITRADIQGGVMTAIRLFLAKAGGSASVCVVIEGQKLPPCAIDTLPPGQPWPKRDSAAIGGCWVFSSAWLSGKVAFYDSGMKDGLGIFRPDSGGVLEITTWARHGDTLAAILISPDPLRKWLLYGFVLGKNEGWTGTITDHATGKTTPFGAKSLPCSMMADDSVPNPPKPDPVGSIPMPGSGAPKATLCFEMRFDYANPACEIQGHAKMEFFDGKIPYGNILVADTPGRSYMGASGSYDSAAIRLYGVSDPDISGLRDTLTLNGYLGGGATMAKGDYVRLPSGKKGIWTMKLVACGSQTFKSPDPSCAATKAP